MYDLVKENNQGDNITTSMNVAIEFDKSHGHVLRDIDKLSCSEEFRQLNFTLSSYTGFNGKRARMFEMTKDGLLFLFKGYKREKSRVYKENFIAEFEKQDDLLKTNNLMKTPEMKMQDFRRRKILEISAKSFRSAEEALYLNMIVLASADSILREMGKEYIVVSEKKTNHKLGECYKNAADNMMDKYEYVEGYIMGKSTGFRTAHAWNVDATGKFVDTTIRNAEEYKYFGVKIPKSIVFDVGYKNGGIWYAALPFIDSLDLDK